MSDGCGSGTGGCGCASAAVQAAPQGLASSAPASVNGVPLHEPGEQLDADTLRQRACSELLRQAAQRGGLLGVGDTPVTDGVLSEAASQAIEALLERELQLPAIDDEALRRHHAAHAARYRLGERVRARHILFAVTPGVDVNALRQRAEGALVSLRCSTDEPQIFADQAALLSNCPSGAEGGDLGWLQAAELVPEFAGALFGQDESTRHVGVLPTLVHSRFGFHVVEVLERDTGLAPGFEEVRAAVAQSLHQQSYVTALRQYLQLLAGKAKLVGVALDGSDSPLVQ